MNEVASPDTLTHELALASQGDRDAARRLFESFLRGPLVIPRRFQAHPMSDAPVYPTELFDILGINDGGRTIVPVFGNIEQLQSWSGSSLIYRTMSGADLISLLPEGWWVCINPGTGIEKDLSPWELHEISKGPAGIAAVLEELESDGLEPLRRIVPLTQQDIPSIAAALIDYAKRNRWIRSLKVARAEHGSEHEEGEQRLLLGVEASRPPSSAEQQEVSDLARAAAIGESPLRLIFAFPGGDPFESSQLAAVDPIYLRRSAVISLLQRLKWF